MTSKQAFRGGLAALAGVLLCTVSFSLAAAQQSKLRIVQTNNAGDTVSIIDPATNKVVAEIPGSRRSMGLRQRQTAAGFISPRNGSERSPLSTERRCK